MNVHNRQAAAIALGGGIETGLVDYVVTSTANQSGLLTLTF